MFDVVLGILTFVLILVSLFLILVVLMQKGTDGGVGASMGGGMAEATFGADTGNVLTKATINASIALFVLSFAIYLGRLYEVHLREHANGNALPNIVAPLPPLNPLSPKPFNAPPSPLPPGTAPLPATPGGTH
jgi:preprotein translocase subunit SecG